MSLRLFAVTATALTCLLPAVTVADATPDDVRVPFRVGEVLHYEVSWSRYFTAGRATLHVTDRQSLGGGRSGYGLKIEGQSVSAVARLVKLYYKTESVIDTATLAPVRTASYGNEDGLERVKSISFGPNNSAHVEMRSNATLRKTITVPARTLDMLSALYFIRTLPVKAGQSITIPIVDGDVVSNVRFDFGAKEIVSTGLGKLPAWRVTPVRLDTRRGHTAGRQMTFWLSDDAARKPLRFEAALPVGTVSMTLAK